MTTMMMSFTRRSSAIRSFQALCIIGVALSVVLTDNSVGDSRFGDDTKLALSEIHKIFRHLFPLVPEKTHYIWKASHLGETLTLNQPDNHMGYIDNIETPSAMRHPHHREPSVTADVDLREKQFAEINPEPTITSPHVVSPLFTVNHAMKPPRRLQPPPLGKRGPECMRKCIAQGVLHPVQCHSLC